MARFNQSGDKCFRLGSRSRVYRRSPCMFISLARSPSIGIESTSHQSKVRFLLADRTARHHFKRNFLINFVGHEDIVLGQTSRYSSSLRHMLRVLSPFFVTLACNKYLWSHSCRCLPGNRRFIVLQLERGRLNLD